MLDAARGLGCVTHPGYGVPVFHGSYATEITGAWDGTRRAYVIGPLHPRTMARVLIVDDTEIVRKALEMALRRMGHEIESASSALVALELARARPPDLALLDVCMPVMDGVALLGEMHVALGDRCPKVLFISATPPEELNRSTALARVVGYVKKPFLLADLSRAVAEALAS